MRRALLALSALCAWVASALAATPGQDVLLFGGVQPAYYCNYAAGSLCGGEAYSGPSLRMITDATGTITYAPNNLVLRSGDLTNAAWANSGINVSPGVADPLGGTSAFTLTSTATGAQIYQGVAPTYAGNAINSVWIRRRTGAGVIKLETPPNTATSISVTPSWSRVGLSGAVTAGGYFALTVSTSGDSIDVYAPAFSAVTYETAPRPGDQAVTTSAAYYGPGFSHSYPIGSPSLGLQYEPSAATNLFLNSGSPATQTIAVANGSTYTVSFYGTGSITLSGALTQTMTGSAGVRTTYTGVASSTSLTATVSGLGATSYPNVTLGSVATSPIPTAGSPLARAADSLTTQGSLTSAVAAGPSALEWTSEATGATSCIKAAAGAFAWPTNPGLIASLKVWPRGTPSAKAVC